MMGASDAFQIEKEGDAPVLIGYEGPGGHVRVPDGVKTIRAWRTRSDAPVRRITLPKSVKCVDAGAFENVTSLERLTLSGPVTVCERAFAGCSSLRTVDAPHGVAVRGPRAFQNCASLRQIHLSPRSPHALPPAAFCGCASLRAADLSGSGIRVISSGAFQNCVRLEEVSLPGSLHVIGARAFAGCSLLKSVRIPRGIWETGPDCFSGCPKIHYDMDLPIGNTMDARGLLSANAEPEAFARVILAQDPSLWRAHVERMCLVYPKLGPRIVRALAEMLAAATGRISTGSWKRATAFVTQMGNVADQDALELFVALSATRGNPVHVDLVRDRRMAARLPGSALAIEDEDPAGRAAHADWIYTPDVELLRRALSRVPYNASGHPEDAGESCDVDAVVRIVVGCQRLVPDERENWDFAASRDDTADEIAHMLDREHLCSLLSRSGAMSENCGGVAVPAWCRYARGESLEDERPRYSTDRYWSTLDEYVKRCMLLNDDFSPDEHNDEWRRMRGFDLRQVRARELEALGFGTDGKRRLDLGGRFAEAVLLDDLTITVLMDGKKPVKTIPASGCDPARRAQAMEWLRKCRSDIRKSLGRRAKFLSRALLSASAFTVESFRRYNVEDPVLRRVASGVVWEQNGRRFTVTTNGLCRASGTTFRLGEGDVRLAHPCEMRPKDVDAWRAYFAERGISQPIRQLDAPALDVDKIDPDRYAGVKVHVDTAEALTMFQKWFRKQGHENTSFLNAPGCQVLYRGGFIGKMRGYSGLRHVMPQYDAVLDRVYPTDEARRANDVIRILDNQVARSLILRDDVRAAAYFDTQDRQAIEELLRVATEGSHAKCVAALLEHSRQRFGMGGALDGLEL